MSEQPPEPVYNDPNLTEPYGITIPDTDNDNSDS